MKNRIDRLDCRDYYYHELLELGVQNPTSVKISAPTVMLKHCVLRRMVGKHFIMEQILAW